MKKALSIRVKGIVQGVGFRPFVHRMARQHEVCGRVFNDTEGVIINIEGEERDLDEFLRRLQPEAPPLASVFSISTAERSPSGYTDFRIEQSRSAEERLAFYSPDAALCEECRAEFFDQGNRRHLYPFITCINCGPRFSIVGDIPYDRKNTSMAPFEMCDSCRAEYDDPFDRRFHSQPNACPNCGPRMSLYDRLKNCIAWDDVRTARETVRLLDKGKIVAIKGIGGYHLAADALNDNAIAALRERKCRPFKPFAIMSGSLEAAEAFLDISQIERGLLLSKERPIVLLRETKAFVSRQVAPRLTYLGLMLPYTPFQHHLFSIRPEMVLVMTSGNVTDEPIEYRDESVFDRLGRIADYFVTYNREIIGQGDDSVQYVIDEVPYFIRRSRGYVPAPLLSSESKKIIFAIGGDLKNSFAIARKSYIILSQYLGDMADPLTLEVFKKTVRHFVKIYDAAPEVVVTDMHPAYLTRQHGREILPDGGRLIEVQHHHAHIAAVMEENNIVEPVIGLAFDGTGYGTDGNLWGSEFLIARRDSFERAAHFSYFPLPGGESAITDVWKIGLSMLYQAYGREYPIMKRDAEAGATIEILEKKINSPLTCSIGRIFDGISAILGICHSVTTEAEAAQLLEEAAFRGRMDTGPFILPFTETSPIVISTDELTRYIVALLQTGMKIEDIAARFHQSIIHTAIAVCDRLREKTGIGSVALSGGVFHNRILLGALTRGLREAGFAVYTHKSVPCNDGCIALGQVVVAKAQLKIKGL